MLRRLFIILLVLAASLPALAQPEWELKADNDGIKVYSSELAGSKIKAIRVTGDFCTTPAQLAAIVMDVNTATDWVYHLKSSTLIKRVSANEIYYYSEVSLPWPVANRDFVAHLVQSEDPVTKAIIIEGPAVEGYMPVKKGIVRINNSTGKWIITPVGPNHVHVDYSIHVDPGGGLPSWLVNMFATDAPMQIFKNLRGEIQKTAARNTTYYTAN